MGGLRHKLPRTFWTMLIGAFALAGFPGLAGWWSKDAILMNVFARYHETHHTIFLALYVMGVAGAFCTAFYTFRLIGLTFFAENRASDEVKAHIHESPLSMTAPLIALAGLSVIGGWWLNDSFTQYAKEELNVRNFFFSEDHHAHMINLVITTIAALGGIGLAWSMYFKGQRIPNPENAKTNFVYRLSLNKFYVDEAYNALIVMPFIIGSEIVHWLVEMLFIDLIVVGSGYAVSFLSGVLRRIQSGLLNWYAGGILIGSLLVLFYLL